MVSAAGPFEGSTFCALVRELIEPYERSANAAARDFGQSSPTHVVRTSNLRIPSAPEYSGMSGGASIFDRIFIFKKKQLCQCSRVFGSRYYCDL